MKTLPMIVFLRITTIFCLKKQEADLIKVLTEEYKIDYQILIVDEEIKIRNYFAQQPKFTQIVTSNQVEKAAVDKNNNILKLGYFLFLKNDEETKEVLDKFDPILFKRYIWFIKTYHVKNVLEVELEFDMDINLLHEADHGIDIYELYGLEGRIMLEQFGRYFENNLTYENLNRLERRTNLMGLTLRYFNPIQYLMALINYKPT